jgi:hypothetical protein
MMQPVRISHAQYYHHQETSLFVEGVAMEFAKHKARLASTH